MLSGVRRDHFSVPGDENDVGTAGLLNKGARGCIRIEILIVPFSCASAIANRLMACSARFDMSGSVGGGTVKVGYAEAEGGHRRQNRSRPVRRTGETETRMQA